MDARTTQDIDRLITQLFEGTLSVPERRWIMAVGCLWGVRPPTPEDNPGQMLHVCAVAEQLLTEPESFDEWNHCGNLPAPNRWTNDDRYLDEYCHVILLYLKHHVWTVKERTWAEALSQ